MNDSTQPRLRDVPLSSDDMRVCSDALKALCREKGVDKDPAVVSRVGSIIIELWRQGVQDVEQLKLLAGATLKDKA